MPSHPAKIRTNLSARETAVALIAVMLGLMAGRTDAAPAAPEILINGKGPVDGLWSFAIGGKNSLQVKGAPAGVGVEMIAPDGSRFPLDAVDQGSGGYSVDLGPLLAKPEFTYREGLVFASGYGLEIGLKETGEAASVLRLQQVPAKKFTEWKFGDPVTGNTGFLALNTPISHRFNPAKSPGVIVDYFLGDGVLLDNGAISVLAALRANAPSEDMDFRLRVIDAAGTELKSKQVTLGKGPPTAIETIDAKEWAEGSYRFVLEPIQDGRVFADGLTLVYHRDRRQDGGIWISPVLPWRLERRSGADSLTNTQFWGDGGSLPPGWVMEGSGSRRQAVCQGSSEPLLIHPNLEGLYAVYVTPLDRGCLISVGQEKMVRACKLGGGEQFVTVADLTGQNIRIHGFDWIEKEGKKSGIQSIRFEPVTEAAAGFLKKLGQPEISLTGIDDWMEYFHGGARLQRDQIYAILRGQQEVGLDAVAWSTGRSLVEYHSNLPTTTRFPAKPLASLEAEHPKVHVYKSREAMINLLCPFRSALEDAGELDLSLEAWLGMNRHYGADVMDGVFTSQWFVDHQDWRQWRKNASAPNRGEMCFYFPGVRDERLAILNELVSIGARTLTLDTTRQVPMLLYHPAMVEAYIKEFGRDPRKFGIEKKDDYLHWIRWRSEFFTRLLRDLRAATKAQNIAIHVRVPQFDWTGNLAMGLDIRTWLEERLIDQLLLNPLEVCQGEGLGSIADYLPACEKYGVKVSVGIGATWMSRPGFAPGLRRAAGLQAGGVKRMDLYEAEYLAFLTEARWLPAVMGSAGLTGEFFKLSNLEACYPILPETACNALDNHSRWLDTGWTLEGTGINSL